MVCRFLAFALVATGALVAPNARADGYDLDALSRSTPRTGPVACPSIELVSYRGSDVRYAPALRVHAAFAARLAAFERAVQQTAIEIYGRAPVRIHDLGTYSCRKIGGYPTLLSEHAFGNAIDVDAFEFGPADAAHAKADLPKALARPFRVTILRDWRGSGPIEGVHRRFLRALVRRLVDTDVFRVVLGPSYPGHANHLHLDMAPYRLIDAE